MRLCLIAALPNAAALLAGPGPLLTPRPPLVPTRGSPAPTMLSAVDSETWCELVEGCDGLAVVFFYAPWCRNCKAVRPALERVERRFGSAAAEGGAGAAAEASFFEVDFQAQTKLCYDERVFRFPTVHFYLPGLGRVGRCVLTAKEAEPRLRATLSRLLDSRQQLQQVSEAALAPLVRYNELASALQGLAAAAAAPPAVAGAAERDGSELQPQRLRSMVEADERHLASLEELFRRLDTDEDGRLQLGDLEAAAVALQPGGGAASGALLERLASGGASSVAVDRASFVTLMVDKAVADFRAPEQALLPAFAALDANGDGLISQEDLIGAIDALCAAQPDADGCDVEDLEQLPLRLTEAVAAFADDGQLLDYERFVEMVSGRSQASKECELRGDEDEDCDDEEGEEGGAEGAEGETVADRIARAVATAAPVAPAAAAAKVPFQDFERECFKPQGEDDDFACDGWYYGEDPTKEKKVLTGEVTEDKMAALRAEGEALVARRAAVQAAQEAARRAATDSA